MLDRWGLAADIGGLPDLLPGDVGFSRIAGWVGGPIAIGQGLLDLVDIIRPQPGRYAENLSIWTHAYMVLPGGRVWEAMPSGARIARLDGRWGRGFAYGRVPLTDEQRAGVLPLARELAGTRYGFSDYAALALWELGLPGRQLVRNYVSSNGRMICSQGVDHIWCRLGYHLFDDGRLPQDVTPGALSWQVARRGRLYLTAS